MGLRHDLTNTSCLSAIFSFGIRVTKTRCATHALVVSSLLVVWQAQIPAIGEQALSAGKTGNGHIRVTIDNKDDDDFLQTVRKYDPSISYSAITTDVIERWHGILEGAGLLGPDDGCSLNMALHFSVMGRITIELPSEEWVSRHVYVSTVTTFHWSDDREPLTIRFRGGSYGVHLTQKLAIARSVDIAIADALAEIGASGVVPDAIALLLLELLPPDKGPAAPSLLSYTDKTVHISNTPNWPHRNILRRVVDKCSLQTLRTLAGSDRREIRREAAGDMGRHGGEAVETLVRMLGDVAPEVRAAAARSLGRIKDSRVVESLIDRLAEETARLIDEPFASKRFAAEQRLLSLLREKALDKQGEEEKERLLAFLNDPGELSRRALAEALGEISNSRAVPCLVRSLEDPRWAVREAAARALGGMQDRRALTPLLDMLESGRSPEAARRALDTIDPHWPDRLEAQKALARIRHNADSGEEVAAGGEAGSGHITITIGNKDDDEFLQTVRKYDPSISYSEITTDVIERWHGILEGAGLLGPDDGCSLNMALHFSVMGRITIELPSEEWVSRHVYVSTVTTFRWSDDREPLTIRFRGGSYGVHPTQKLAIAQSIDMAMADALAKVGASSVVLDKSVVHAIVPMLEGTDSHTREVAARALGRIGEESAVPALLEALDAGWGRGAIIEALGLIGDERALPALLDATKDRSVRVRQNAAEALGRIRNERAFESLVALLEDKRDDTRESAVEALGMLGDQRALPHLVRLLSDENWRLRAAAARALGQLGSREAVEPLTKVFMTDRYGSRKDAAEALTIILGKEAAEPFTAFLKDKDDDIRKSAVEAFGQLGDTRAVEPLIARLGDKSYGVREAAVEALVKRGKPAVQPLVNCLKDTNVRVQEAAIRALGDMGDTRAVPPLIDCLALNSVFLARAAAKALGQLGDTRAVEPMIALLGERRTNGRPSIALALGQLGDARALTPLIACLSDGSSLVRVASAKALGQLGDSRAVEPLITSLKDETSNVRCAASRSLGQLNDARAVEPLIACLKDEDDSVHFAAVEALGRLRDARAVVPLIPFLDHENEALQWRTIEALAEIGDPRAIEPLQDLHAREKGLRTPINDALAKIRHD